MNHFDLLATDLTFSARVVFLTLLYFILLYCIVSIHLHSASCSAQQSEALPVRETQRAVLRERKEALGSPVNKVDRVEGRSWFQSEGPMIAKARV